MKFKIEVKKGDWHVPYVKRFFGWVQISGGRTNRNDAIFEIGKYVLNETM